MSQVQGRGTRGKRGAPEDRMVGLTLKGLVSKFDRIVITIFTELTSQGFGTFTNKYYF